MRTALSAASVLAVVSIAAIVSESQARPEDFSFRTIVRTGQAAPGTPQGVVFTVFNGTPGVGHDFAPTIDDQGNLVFHAGIAGPGVVGGEPMTGNGLGVWKHSGGQTTLIARQGDMAADLLPGTEFDGFASFELVEEPTIGASRSLIVATLRGEAVQTGINDFGIWGTNGDLGLRVRLGDPAPGVTPGSVFETMGRFHNRGGNLFLDAGWGNRSNPSAPRGDAYWSDRGGPLAPVVKAGDAAPGAGSGIVFGENGSIAPGIAFREWWVSDAKAVVLHANLRGSGIDDLNDEGIWAEGPGGLQLIAREGATAPGDGPRVEFGTANGFDAFGGGIALRMNVAGAVLFGAHLHGSRVPFMHSLWTTRSGALERLAQATSSAEVAGDAAPGMPAGATFSMLSLAEISEGGRVAFAGRATVGGGQELDGLWWDMPGALTLVARQGGAVSELPGQMFLSLRRSLAFGSEGVLYFVAGLAPTGSPSETSVGLFRVRPGGGPELVLRTGDLFDLSGNGTDLRRMAVMLAGAVNAREEVPIELAFDDGSSAIVVAQPKGIVAVGEPPALSNTAWLGAARPNPRTGAQPLEIPFALERAQQVRVDILDVTGRRLDHTARFHVPAGATTVRWEAPILPPGIYWLEARTASGESAVRRWIQVSR